MNKKLALLATPIVMLATSTPVMANCDWCFTPYVGADAQVRSMGLKRGYGKELTTDNYPQGNIYAGLQLNEFLSIEGGFETTWSKTSTATLLGNQMFFGRTLARAAPNALFTFLTRTKLHGFHGDIVAFYPFCPQYSLSIFGLVGISALRIKVENDLTAINGTTINDPGTKLNFAKRKTVARAGAGIQHMITERAGVRAQVIWENTSRFKNLISSNFLSSLDIARVQDSFSYGLGIFYKF